MPTTLAIGDFARITHLSVKTLRHYHEVGLLEPARIDARTGYRAYGLDQVATAQVILRFRELGMPVREIGTLIRAEPTARGELIAAHLERLEAELVSTQRAVNSLRRLLAPDPAPITVELRSVPATLVAAIEADVERPSVAAWWRGALAELRAALGDPDSAITGTVGGVYDGALFTEDRGHAIVYLPADDPPSAGRVRPLLLPAVELAVVVHEGPHDDLDVTYGALGTYVTEQAIGISGPMHERYLVGPAESDDRSSWRTEIGWPVFHATPSN